ncbi:hypothetical protein ACLB2K_043540 [Fragaria x ananassa]
MTKASETALDLIESLCSWDPSNRPSAAEALRNPLITKARNVLAPPPGFTRAGNVLAHSPGKQNILFSDGIFYQK